MSALSVLSPNERREFSECEAIIQKGWDTFVEVGQALARIRDKKLYRAQYVTFEEYCRHKWLYGKSHVYRLIGAAQVVACLSPIGDIPVPIHEAQVRPLIGLQPHEALVAWKRAVEKSRGALVTAKLVKQAVAETVTTLLSEPVQGKVRPIGPRARKLNEALRLLSQAESTLLRTEETRPVLRLLADATRCLNDLKKSQSRANTPGRGPT